MHRFFIKIPFWVRWLFPDYVWRLPVQEKVLYLTFDDGPHPQITPFVLEALKKAGAKATFFCIGKNVEAYPDVYQRILADGHAVGNHTYHHCNGSKTGTAVYLEDIARAAPVIDSNLFRPPYGRIRRKQAAGVAKAMSRPDSRIIMWDVLSADFDRGLSPEQCLNNVVRYAKPGSVIVFHDSEKAFPNLRYALPKALACFANAGYVCAPIRL